MRRFHLFEFEDFSWFPSQLRNCVTDFLRTVAEKFGMFEPVVPHLIDLLEESEQLTIVDMASGAGGQWRTLLPEILDENKDARLVLTDKYPNAPGLSDFADQFGERVIVDERSIDVVNVPKDLEGVRTMFLSLHHFKEEEVTKIFEDAVREGSPIAIFEAQQRDLEHVVRFSLSPLAVLLLTPTIRPLSLFRLVFTYLIPIVPFVVFWDGVVSVLRTYTNEELEQIAKSVDSGQSFDWSSELILKGQQKIQVFIGRPTKTREIVS